MKSNQAYASRPRTENGLALTALDSNVKGLILINRRSGVDVETNSRRRQLVQDLNIEIHTYDYQRERNYGNQLSGGEQQMLAISPALMTNMTNPRLLILDEATEGLAPLIREEIWRCLARLKAEGQSILVVDKDIKALAALCSRHYILEKGRVAWTGTSAQLLERPDVQRAYLGV